MAKNTPKTETPNIEDPAAPVENRKGRVKVQYLGKKPALALHLPYMSESVSFGQEAGNMAWIKKGDAAKLIRQNPQGFRVAIDVSQMVAREVESIAPEKPVPQPTATSTETEDLKAFLGAFPSIAAIIDYCKSEYELDLNDDLTFEQAIEEAAEGIVEQRRILQED